MKKFHGSRVPRPRMKKVTPTRQPLQTGHKSLQQDIMCLIITTGIRVNGKHFSSVHTCAVVETKTVSDQTVVESKQ